MRSERCELISAQYIRETLLETGGEGVGGERGGGGRRGRNEERWGDLGEDMGRGNIGDEEVGGHAGKGMGGEEGREEREGNIFCGRQGSIKCRIEEGENVLK